MLTIAFPAAAFATNCYVLAPAAGEECLVVDPGVGVVDRLREVLAQHRLRPAAVLLTHGHADHVYSVTPVCRGEADPVLVTPTAPAEHEASDHPSYIHPDDRYRLSDPFDVGSPGLVAMLEAEFGQRVTWTEPSNIVEVTDRAHLTIAGIDIDVLHAPGHTEGSVLFVVPDVPHQMADRGLTGTCLSGDVLFAGSIGRTDLPGGSSARMQASLRDVVLPLPDDLLVLPGHGPATMLGHEKAGNPYLQGLRG